MRLVFQIFSGGLGGSVNDLKTKLGRIKKMNKIRLTQKTLKNNISLYRGSLPGTLAANALKFSPAFEKLIDDSCRDFEQRIYSRLERLGWIEYRGCPIITVDGYKNL